MEKNHVEKNSDGKKSGGKTIMRKKSGGKK